MDYLSSEARVDGDDAAVAAVSRSAKQGGRGGKSKAVRNQQTVTVRDVAREAGVALSTVSAVLRDDPTCYVSDKTRARVIEAATRLGYRRNRFASALRGTQSMTIGLLFESLMGPTVTMNKLAPIERLASDAGYRVIVANYYNSPRRQREHIQEFVASRVDGIILVTADPDNADLVQQLTRQQMPLVTIDSIYDFPTPDIWFDRAAGARMQVEHMLAAGCKKLVFITSLLETGLAPRKVQGYRDALAAHGQRLEDHIVIDLAIALTDNRYLRGAECINWVLRQGLEFDGIICSADSVAIGALQALQQAGLRVPDDVSIIGYDDTDFAAALTPPLTTIRQPRHVGELALKMLLEQMALKAKGQSWEMTSIRVDPTLVVRQSTKGRAPSTGDTSSLVSHLPFTGKGD